MEKRKVIVCLLILYGVSLALPGVVFEGTKDTILYGYKILFIGWGGFFIGNFAWYANILFFATLASVSNKEGKERDELITSIAAFLLGLTAFMFHSMPINEAGSDRIVKYLGPGYYVWMLTIALLAIYSYQRFKTRKSSNVLS